MEFETLATGYGLVEGPRIDEQNRLYYSDIRGGGVFRRSPDGEIETLIPERKFIGGIALNTGGGLVVSGRSLAFWDEKSGNLRDLFAESEGKLPKRANKEINRLNRETNRRNREAPGKAFGAGHQRVWSARRRRFGLTKPEEPQAADHRTGRGDAGTDEQSRGGAAADATRAGAG